MRAAPFQGARQMLSPQTARALPLSAKWSAALICAIMLAVVAVSLASFDVQTTLASCVLAFATLVIAISDARRFIVPDWLSLPLIPAGLAATWLLADRELASTLVLAHLVAASIAASALYGIRYVYSIWRQRIGLGLGDVKLAAVAGAWTGPQGISHVLLLACVMALLFVGLAHLRDHRSINASTPVPLGTFLAPSIWIVWCINTLSTDGGAALLFVQT